MKKKQETAAKNESKRLAKENKDLLKELETLRGAGEGVHSATGFSSKRKGAAGPSSDTRGKKSRGDAGPLI